MLVEWKMNGKEYWQTFEEYGEAWDKYNEMKTTRAVAWVAISIYNGDTAGWAELDREVLA